MIFNAIIDLAIRILIFIILATVTKERNLVASSRDEEIKKASRVCFTTNIGPLLTMDPTLFH